ncbi:MAG: leucine-rich repeat domain-containing protein [Clostridia bacterium]
MENERNTKQLIKTSNGITLIALVITIIILLILAGVTIATLTGDNGILTQAGNAKEATQKAEAQEEVNLALANLKIEENQRDISQDEKKKILFEELKQFYPEQEPESIVSVEGEKIFIKHRGYEFNESIEFDAEVWDKTAAPENCFIWGSDTEGEEGYNIIIGYTEELESYTKVRIPSRCKRIVCWDDSGKNEANGRAFFSNVQKVEIPNTVVELGGYAFGNAYGVTVNLKEIVIPDSVTIIGVSAFANCTNLSSITIPNTIASVGNYAFYNTAWYDKQTDGLLYIGKVLYEYKGKMPENTNIQIKEGTTSITDSAFENCTNLSSITIPEGVTSIGDAAFADCTNLSSITIPSSVKSIGKRAFWNSTSLNSIIIPNSVTNMGWATFYSWASSQTINIQGYTSAPSGWSSAWNADCSATINWGQ